MTGEGLSVLSKHGDVLSTVLCIDEDEASLTIVMSSDDGTSKFLELEFVVALQLVDGLKDILRRTLL